MSLDGEVSALLALLQMDAAIIDALAPTMTCCNRGDGGVCHSQTIAKISGVIMKVGDEGTASIHAPACGL